MRSNRPWVMRRSKRVWSKTLVSVCRYDTYGGDRVIYVQQENMRMKVAVKWNRCVEFTLPNNKVIVVKVSGEKAAAAVIARELVEAINQAGVASHA